LRPGDVETIRGHSASALAVKLDRAIQLVPPWSRPGVAELGLWVWLFVPPWARPGDVAVGSSSLVEF
jgi:hypothetical protein